MSKISFIQVSTFILSYILRIWSKTLRYKQIGYEQVESIRQNSRVIFALWHDELFSPCYLHRDEGIIAIVSASKDGELLAQVLKRLGFNLARGSSTRGGFQALREAHKKVQILNKDVVFTVDGPKGPRHSVKEGAIYLAYRAKAFIVPVRVKNYKAKYFHKAWDRFQLPWPCSKSEVLYGEPYLIDYPKLTTTLLEKEQNKLKEKMASLSNCKRFFF